MKALLGEQLSSVGTHAQWARYLYFDSHHTFLQNIKGFQLDSHRINCHTSMAAALAILLIEVSTF